MADINFNVVTTTLEKIANKSTDVNTDQASNTKFPSVKAVYDWAVGAFQAALGFTPENVANKSTSIVTDQASNTKYPSVKSVYDWVTSAASANNQRIGNLITDTFASASNYTQVQTSGSQTFGSNQVTFAGNGGNFTNNHMTYNYNTLGTFLEDYYINTTFASTANSASTYGFGIGANQAGNTTFALMMSTASAGTRGTLYIVDPTTGTVNATSATQLVYTNTTDVIYLELRYTKTKVYGIARNITTPTRSESGVNVPNDVAVEFTITGTGRVSKPYLISYGGTQIATTFNFGSEEFQNPKVVLIGDSRTVGATASSYNRRWASLYGASGSNKIMVWARGGATVADFSSAFTELTNIVKTGRPWVVVVGGINDAIIGRTLAQFQADILTVVNNIQAAGWIPVLTKIAYVTSGATNAAAVNALVLSYNNWLATLGIKLYDENTGTTTSGALTSTLATADGIHFNDLGNSTIAELIKVQLNSIYQHIPSLIYDGTYQVSSSPTIIRKTQISDVVGSSTESGLYVNVGTPTANNFNIKSDGTDTVLNAPSGTVFIRSANTGFGGGSSLFTAVGSTGNVSVGPPVTNQRLFSINQDTGPMSLGSLVGTTSLAAIYMKSGTLSGTNYTIAGDATNTAINAPGTTGAISFNQGGVSRGAIGSTNWQFYNGTAQTSGNPTQFYFLPSANTGQTAGAGFKLFHADLAVTIQHASNTAVTNDKGFYVTAPTVAFATSGGTSTDATTFEVSAPPTQGTNATLTRPWTARFLNGNTAIGGSLYIGAATTLPTALLHLAAGTATASTAPLKFNSGTNLTTPENGAVEYDGTNYFVTSGSTRYTLAKTLTATATLDFGSTAASSSTDLTITVTGAADGDSVTVTPPNGSVVVNSIYTAWVSSANTVTVRFSNLDITNAANPASGTFRAVVFKY